MIYWYWPLYIEDHLPAKPILPCWCAKLDIGQPVSKPKKPSTASSASDQELHRVVPHSGDGWPVRETPEHLERALRASTQITTGKASASPFTLTAPFICALCGAKANRFAQTTHDLDMRSASDTLSIWFIHRCTLPHLHNNARLGQRV